MGMKVIDKPNKNRRGFNGRVYPYDKDKYTGIYRQFTDEKIRKLGEANDNMQKNLAELNKDPKHRAKREAYENEKKAKLEEREKIRAEHDAELAEKRAQKAIKKAVTEASKAEKDASEKAEREEFIKLSEKVDLDSLVLAYYKQFQNSKFLDFAISALPQILPHLDENLLLNRNGETFFKHEKTYMENMPKLVEKFGYSKVTQFLYRAYIHNDIKYNKLISETKDEKIRALFIWGKTVDGKGLVKVPEFVCLDEEEKAILLKGLGKEFVKENMSKLVSKYNLFIKTLPEEFRNCSLITEFEKEAKKINQERNINNRQK